MESAALGVILDSSVVIEAERQHLNVAQFLRQIGQTIGEREAALSSITVAEPVHGIYRWLRGGNPQSTSLPENPRTQTDRALAALFRYGYGRDNPLRPINSSGFDCYS
jgi:hypothetical protein